MRTAEAKIPMADEAWFQTLMQQNGWEWTWTSDTEPDFQEEDDCGEGDEGK